MYLDVACNNPDNGIFMGVAPQLQIGWAEFEAKGNYPRFVETKKGFRLAGKNFADFGSDDWVGNWCWNRYKLKVNELIRFVKWLRGRELYQCVLSSDEFSSWFESNIYVPDFHLRPIILDHFLP